MQIQNHEILLNKKNKQEASFKANPTVNKVVKAAADEALKIAGAAAVAIGTAAIALTKKEESIESIENPIKADKDSPELEYIDALSVKDMRIICKKLKISEEDINNLELESDSVRKLFGVALVLFRQNFFEDESYKNIEDFLGLLIQNIKEEDSIEKRYQYTKEAYESYKYCTENNFQLIKQKTETSIALKELFDNEIFQTRIKEIYQFIANYNKVSGEKFKLDSIVDFRTSAFPSLKELEATSKALQKSGIKFDSKTSFEKVQDLENPEFAEKLKLKEEYPEVPYEIVSEIAKTDLDIKDARKILNVWQEKFIKDLSLKERYYLKEITEVCKKINKENLNCAISLIEKTANYQFQKLQEILDNINSDNVNPFYFFAKNPTIDISSCLQIIKSRLDLITKEKLDTWAEKCTNTDDIVYSVKSINEENFDIVEDILLNKKIAYYNKETILNQINSFNKRIAKELLAKDRIEYLENITKEIQENNFEIAEKIWDKYKDKLENRDFSKLLSSIEHMEMSFIEDILNDERFKDCSLGADFIGSITKEKYDLIKEIYYNHPNLKQIELSFISKAIRQDNLEFAKKLLTRENIDKMLNDEFIASLGAICDIIRATTPENINLAKYLLKNKPELCRRIDPCAITSTIIYDLLCSFNGNFDYVVEQVENGVLDEQPQIAKFRTDCWEKIIERKYLDKGLSKHFIELYAKAEDEDIDTKHKELLEDAFAKRDLLKTGLDDLSDSQIRMVFHTPEIIKALDLLGKSNLEAAFPLMIDNFENFAGIVSKMTLSDANKALLVSVINPTLTPEYKTLRKEINCLKKQLNELVGKENLAKINEFKRQQVEILQLLDPLKAEFKTLQAEYKENPTPEIEQQIQQLKTEIKPLETQAKALGAQAQSIYFQSENAEQIKEVMKEIGLKTKQAQTIANSSKALDPRDVVLKIRVLAGLSTNCTEEELRSFIEMIRTSGEDKNKAWNDAINKKVFEKIGIEFDQELSDKLRFSESKYLSELFVSSREFFKNLNILINHIKEHPELSIEEALDTLPENQETKRMLEELGIDYHAWTRINKESHTKVEIKLNAEQARDAAIKSLEDDLNDLQFKTLPNEVKDKIWIALAKIGVTFEKSYRDRFVGDGFNAGQEEYWKLFKDSKPIVFEDMPKIMSIIKEVINKDEFWTKRHYDSEVETARGTMYEHLIKLRTADVDNARALKEDEVHEIEIHKTDMYDIKKALGLGNDGQCCTGLGRNFNEWTAPNYIMYKCIGAIELTDNGNFVGNTMIFIAMVDGEPALVLDNIELKTKYQNNPKIRNAFVEYAKKLCEELGKPDMAIYAGPNRHKLDMSIFPKDERQMRPIGSTGKGEVYMDYATGRRSVNSTNTESVFLYKIR